MKIQIQQIDYACEHKVRTTYRGNSDYFHSVVAKPKEATGLLKWKIRLIKAWNVFLGNADAFKYSAHQ